MVEPLVDKGDHQLEHRFLSLVECGDKNGVQKTLRLPNLDTNFMDKDNRNALQIAVQNCNADILKILLEHGIKLDDILLRAVDVQFLGCIKVICEYIKKEKLTEALHARCTNEDFHPDVTPIVLAAHHNEYNIIKLLVEQGAFIEDPEDFSFQTEEFTLPHSLGLLQVYKALASQSYISITSGDPIQTAFSLTTTLRKLSQRYFEFGFQYEELADQCEQYAADLLDEVRNSKEQQIVLNHDPKMFLRSSGQDSAQSIQKVKQAIKHEQKKFVAHPTAQQRVTENWTAGLAGWRKQSQIKSLAINLAIFFGCPLICFAHLIAPIKPLKNFLKVPHVKFLMETSSSLTFLALLITVYAFHPAIQEDTINGQAILKVYSYPKKGTQPSILEWLIILWILGMIWQNVKGFKDKMELEGTSLGQFNELITLVVYTLWIILRLYAWIDYPKWNSYNTFYYDDNGHSNETDINHFGYQSTASDATITFSLSTSHSNSTTPESLLQEIKHGVDSLLAKENKEEGEIGELLHKLVSLVSTRDAINISSDRSSWHAYDVVLLSEGIFAMASILSFLRIIRIAVLNKHIGPVEISLGRMINDVIKFVVIFAVIMLAFSVGLTQLYSIYQVESLAACKTSSEGPEDCLPGPFSNTFDALKSLFWILFGLTDLTSLLVPHDQANHYYTEIIGSIIYAAYHVISIVVLLNVLIAMLSNTYTRVEEDADTQWKYSKTILSIGYMDGQVALPPPFNIIPSIALLIFVSNWIKTNLRSKKARKNLKTIRKSKSFEKSQEYQNTVQALAKRYVFKRMRVEEEDAKADLKLIELKQTFSSFQYEVSDAFTEINKTLSEIQKGEITEEVEEIPPPTEPLAPLPMWGEFDFADEV